MTEARRRTAALLIAALMAVAGAVAVSVAFAPDTHAFGNTGNNKNAQG